MSLCYGKEQEQRHVEQDKSKRARVGDPGPL